MRSRWHRDLRDIRGISELRSIRRGVTRVGGSRVMLIGRPGCTAWIISRVMIRRGRGTAMRHRGRKLAAVEAHGSARRVDASKNGVPFGHDECLSRNEPYCKGWCNNSTFQSDCCSDMSNAFLREESQWWYIQI